MKCILSETENAVILSERSDTALRAVAHLHAAAAAVSTPLCFARNDTPDGVGLPSSVTACAVPPSPRGRYYSSIIRSNSSSRRAFCPARYSAPNRVSNPVAFAYSWGVADLGAAWEWAFFPRR